MAAAPRPVVIRAQAQGALLALGQILIDAGARTQRALRTEAMPPLVEGFHSTTLELFQVL